MHEATTGEGKEKAHWREQQNQQPAELLLRKPLTETEVRILRSLDDLCRTTKEIARSMHEDTPN
jgi:hypothetical protein